MQPIDKRIIDFIKEHHVLTLATCVRNEPYCSNMFYTYMDNENMFVFTSNDKTRHICDVMQNNAVAASIVMETETIGIIRGIQIQGVLLRPEMKLRRMARIAYIQRFPYAVLRGASLWVLRPSFFKFTDNRFGFGKKIIVTFPL